MAESFQKLVSLTLRLFQTRFFFAQFHQSLTFEININEFSNVTQRSIAEVFFEFYKQKNSATSLEDIFLMFVYAPGVYGTQLSRAQKNSTMQIHLHFILTNFCAS